MATQSGFPYVDRLVGVLLNRTHVELGGRRGGVAVGAGATVGCVTARRCSRFRTSAIGRHRRRVGGTRRRDSAVSHRTTCLSHAALLGRSWTIGKTIFRGEKMRNNSNLPEIGVHVHYY